MHENNIDEVAKELSGLIPIITRKLIKPLEQQIKNLLSPMQMHTLFILSEKKSFTMTELSNQLKISNQQMTPIIDKLVECGFVNREHDVADRRTVNIIITLEGLDLINNFQQEISEVMKEKIQSLSQEDLRSLHSSLVEFYRVMNKIL